MTENAIQQQCYMWFHNTYPFLRGLLFAVPNGGARTAVDAKIFKATGVYPGVSDMLFMYRGITVCIEMKTLKGFQSDNQKWWQKKVEEHGFEYHVCRSLQQFKNIITKTIENGKKRST